MRFSLRVETKVANVKGETNIGFRDSRTIVLSNGELIKSSKLRNVLNEGFDVLQICLCNITGSWEDFAYVLSKDLPLHEINNMNLRYYKHLSEAAKKELEHNYFKSIVKYQDCKLTDKAELASMLISKNIQIEKDRYF